MAFPPTQLSGAPDTGSTATQLNNTPDPSEAGGIEPSPDENEQPRLELSDQELSTFGLDGLNVGDTFTAKVTFRVDSKSPGTEDPNSGDLATTKFAITGVTDIAPDAMSPDGDVDAPGTEDTEADDDDVPDSTSGGDVSGDGATLEDATPGSDEASALAPAPKGSEGLAALARKKSKPISPKDAGFRK